MKLVFDPFSFILSYCEEKPKDWSWYVGFFILVVARLGALYLGVVSTYNGHLNPETTSALLFTFTVVMLCVGLGVRLKFPDPAQL